jgi:hypothetical protein
MHGLPYGWQHVPPGSHVPPPEHAPALPHVVFPPQLSMAVPHCCVVHGFASGIHWPPSHGPQSQLLPQLSWMVPQRLVHQVGSWMHAQVDPSASHVQPGAVEQLYVQPLPHGSEPPQWVWQ